MMYGLQPGPMLFKQNPILSFVRGMWKQIKSKAPEVAVEDES